MAASREFKILPFALMALAVAVFSSFGFWQLDRAKGKRMLLDRFERGGDQTVTMLDVLNEPEAERRYQRVGLSGRYDPDRQILLYGMSEGGVVGYHVLTPFDSDLLDEIVLINRGWVPASPQLERLPDIEVDSDRRTVAGRLASLARPGLRLDPAPTPAGWPKVLLYPTAVQIAGLLGQNVHDGVVWLDPEADDGYVRQWKPAVMGPNRHLGYAIQWFAFAATAFLIYLVLTLRKPNPNDGQNDRSEPT